MGDGDGYQYSHEYPENITAQEYMLKPMQFYYPKEVGEEMNIADQLKYWKSLKKKLSTDPCYPR